MTNGRVEVITSVQRRRRWSASEKQELVAASLEPGASVSALARQAGIHASQLYGWRRQLHLNVAAVISRAVDMDLSAVPHLRAWLMRCLERPAARAALALKAKADAETPGEVTRRIARINRL